MLRLLQRFTLAIVIIGAIVGSVYAVGQTYQASAPIGEQAQIDTLVVHKERREMQAYNQGKLVKTYMIALGFTPQGHKQFEGDGKTPEGWYTINDRNPHSGYHKNLGVSYQNAADRAYAAEQGKSAGGDIKIHGLPNRMLNMGTLHRLFDWTNGCIAVTNEEMDELYAAVIPNAKIHIQP